jgi:hypothetical protein
MVRPLWLKTNSTLYSSPFNVPAGQTAILYAVGFGKFVTRKSAVEWKANQRAIIHRLLFEYESKSDSAISCGGIIDMKTVQSKVLVDQPVCRCGCEWGALTMGNNLALLGLPGNYLLQFNSEEMIGKAQVYLELYDNNNLPVHALQGLYF